MAYILLAAVGLLPLVALMFRRRDPTLVATFFFAGGILIVAEYVALGLYELYQYRPGLLASPLSDTALGIILAELLFVAALPVVTTTYLSRIWGPLLGTALVMGIEALFLALGLFTHTGWSLWYTAVGFPLYFLAVRLYREAAVQMGLTRGAMLMLARLGIITWWHHLLGISIAWLFRLVTYNLQVLPTFARNQALGWGLTDWLFAAPLALWVIAAAPARRALRVVVALLLLFLLAHLWRVTGVWSFLRSWGPLLHTAAHGLLLGAIWATDNLLQRWTSLERKKAGAG